MSTTQQLQLPAHVVPTEADRAASLDFDLPPAGAPVAVVGGYVLWIHRVDEDVTWLCGAPLLGDELGDGIDWSADAATTLDPDLPGLDEDDHAALQAAQTQLLSCDAA